jgi:uncharacterized RDD family membrane protein YckC
MVRSPISNDTIPLAARPATGGDTVYCQKCGAQNDDQAAFCDKCGTALQKPQPATAATGTGYPGEIQYAGFWRRLAASVIDGLIVGAVPTVIYYSLMGAGVFSMPEIAEEEDIGPYISWMIRYSLISSGIMIVLQTLYFAIMESSSKQATVGKMVLGIIVTDVEGKRISLGRAVGRNLGKIVSQIILYIGYLMIAFTQKKQGLHDMMANCLVVVKR